MYKDHKKLLSCFNTHKRHSGSIKDLFSQFLGDNIEGNKFLKSRKIDKLFLRESSGNTRGLLADYEENNLNENVDESTVDDDQMVLDLISRYLNGLDGHSRSNRFKIKSMLVLFLCRRIAYKYDRLEINSNTTRKLLEDAYNRLVGSKVEILSQLHQSIIDCVIGGSKYKPIDNSYKSIVSRFMIPHDELDAIDAVNELEPDVEVTETSDIKLALEELGYNILLIRNERLVTSKNFPYLSHDQRVLMRTIIKDYRTIYLRLHSKPNITLISELIGIDNDTVTRYKSKIAEELNNLAVGQSAISINQYLLNG